MEIIGMLLNNQMDNIKNIILLTEEFFANNVSNFNIETFEDSQDFYIDCLVYRSFWIRLNLADVEKGGVFSIDVSIGKITPLYALIENAESLELNFDKQSIKNNFEILNSYLLWRMTDNQKKTYHFL